jgi:hypothetical protein
MESADVFEAISVMTPRLFAAGDPLSYGSRTFLSEEAVLKIHVSGVEKSGQKMDRRAWLEMRS